ncbi:hypothetical protein FXV75_14790 [Marinomonas sp. IMCC 4694]|nr:hypothetical protein FXV75_14790 [Marinomonas sp. IMCC 4694]
MNISAYEGTPPASRKEGRVHIDSGPLYDKSTVLALLDKGDTHTNLWTKKCIQDVQRLEFEIRDVRALLKQALSHGRYVNSEWCVQKPTGPWAACDSYFLARMEWIENAGKLLLLVSCHLSQ